MNKKRLTVTGIANFIGFVVLYTALALVKGMDYANENTLLTALQILGVEGVGLLGYVFYLIFIEIPNEIDREKREENEQLKQVIKERKEEILQAESKPEPPSFYLRRHRATVVIGDQNADVVRNFLYQLYDKPRVHQENNIRIEIQKFTYHKSVRDELFFEGTKEVFPVGTIIPKISELIKNPALLNEQIQKKVYYLHELLIVSVIQGGNNTTQVIFHTNDKNVYEIIPKRILKRLQEVFVVTSIKGLPEEPEIIISPAENGALEYDKDRDMYQVARMKVYNNSSTEITKCFATLQLASDIYNHLGRGAKMDLIPSLGNFHRPDRIRWYEDKYMNEKCEIEIPSKDARHLDVADTLGTFHYNLCERDVDANFVVPCPLHTFKIRIDYFNGTTSKFVDFYGYIYAANHQDAREAFSKKGRIKKRHEIQKDQIHYLKMIFKEGDWTENEDVIEYMGITEKGQAQI